MPQTIVNFLTQDPVTSVLSTSARVFDYEIGTTEQTIYTNLLTDLQAELEKASPSAETIASILAQLNTWSTRKIVGSDGTSVTDNSTITISDLRASPTTKNAPTTMNRYMAEDVDKIIRTIRSAGWDPIIVSPTDPRAAAAIAILKDSTKASIYPVQSWITEGLLAASGAILDTGVRDVSGTSLQEMLMVDYVSHGNDLLFNEMSTLSTAINNNQTALSYLNSLQDLLNQKDPKAFLLQLNQLTYSSQGILADTAYSAFEKATFDQEIPTLARFTDDPAGSIATYVTGLLDSSQLEVINAIPNLTTALNTLSGVSGAVATLTTKADAIPTSYSEISSTIASDLDTIIETNRNLPSNMLTGANHAWDAISSSIRDELGGLQIDWDNAVSGTTGLQQAVSAYNTARAAFHASPTLANALTLYEASSGATKISGSVELLTNLATSISNKLIELGYTTEAGIFNERFSIEVTENFTTFSNTVIPSLNPTGDTSYVAAWQAVTDAGTDITTAKTAFDTAKTAFNTAMTAYTTAVGTTPQVPIDIFSAAVTALLALDTLETKRAALSQSSTTVLNGLLAADYNTWSQSHFYTDVNAFNALPTMETSITTLNIPSLMQTFYQQLSIVDAMTVSVNGLTDAANAVNTAALSLSNEASTAQASTRTAALTVLTTQGWGVEPSQLYTRMQALCSNQTLVNWISSKPVDVQNARYAWSDSLNQLLTYSNACTSAYDNFRNLSPTAPIADYVTATQTLIDTTTAFKTALTTSIDAEASLLSKMRPYSTDPSITSVYNDIVDNKNYSNAQNTMLGTSIIPQHTQFLNCFTAIQSYYPNIVTKITAFTSAKSDYTTKKTAYDAAVAASPRSLPTISAAAKDLVNSLTSLNTARDNLNAAVMILANALSTYLPGSTFQSIYNALNAFQNSQNLTQVAKDVGLVSSNPSVPTLIQFLDQIIADGGTSPDLSAISGTAAGAFAKLNPTLSPLFDAQLQRIKDNLNYLITNLATTSGSTSLVSSLKTILNDFNSVTTVSDWVKDYATTQQGNYQTHMNNAIVASQALNDAKREDLRRVMFVFEEFYKSSTSLLSRLTQLIERMANAINR